jgi:YspA, cpYpsA-related SLOG family
MPDKFRVLICGDRNWTSEVKIRDALLALLAEADVARGEVIVVEGEARGADKIGAHVARTLGIEVEEYPANWDKFGRAAGPIRNQQMLDSGLDHAIACHSFLENSKGTADMVRRLDKAGIPVELVV